MLSYYLQMKIENCQRHSSDNCKHRKLEWAREWVSGWGRAEEIEKDKETGVGGGEGVSTELRVNDKIRMRDIPMRNWRNRNRGNKSAEYFLLPEESARNIYMKRIAKCIVGIFRFHSAMELLPRA